MVLLSVKVVGYLYRRETEIVTSVLGDMERREGKSKSRPWGIKVSLLLGHLECCRTRGLKGLKADLIRNTPGLRGVLTEKGKDPASS